MKTALLAILAIIPALAVPAFAAEVQFPTLTTDGMVDYQLDTFYPTNSTYIIQISLLYEVDQPIEIPEKITWIDIEGGAHFVYLQDGFNVAHNPQEEELTNEPQPTYTEEEIQHLLDLEKEKVQEIKDSAFSKLRQCLVEFKEISDITGDQRYYAWERIASLEEFVIPDQWINADHYDRFQLEAQGKWSICEALKKYPHIGAYEANKGLDEDDRVEVQTTFDSPDTIPVTAEDIRQAEIRAEAFACGIEGKSMGLCKDYLAGEYYKIPKPRIPDWYNQYREQNALEPDTALAIDLAMVTQCETYYPLYSATDAIELPTWLSHCEEQ